MDSPRNAPIQLSDRTACGERSEPEKVQTLRRTVPCRHQRDVGGIEQSPAVYVRANTATVIQQLQMESVII